MKWRMGRRSDNVVRARGGGGGGRRFRFGGFRGMSITGILIMMGVAWLFGINPLQFLGLMGGNGGSGTTTYTPASSQGAVGSNSETVDFVRVVVGSTEDAWKRLFGTLGLGAYEAPTLVLYRGSVPTACGMGRSAMGPFYCPGDRKVYLDLTFFQELRTRYGAAGDFARAYVIAHEVGHHVQNLLGIADEVARLRRSGAQMKGADGISVRQELQADCFAGVWARQSEQQYHWLERGDIGEAMDAASGVGDDTLQKQGRGYAVPDSFTHGTSAQRKRWFMAGYDAGSVGACDTFKATRL